MSSWATDRIEFILFSLMLTAFIIVASLVMIVTTRRGLKAQPAAGKTPEEAARQYYDFVLHGRLGEPRLAFVYLLDHAKQAVGTIELFGKYWKGMSATIDKEFAGIFVLKAGEQITLTSLHRLSQHG